MYTNPTKPFHMFALALIIIPNISQGLDNCTPNSAGKTLLRPLVKLPIFQSAHDDAQGLPADQTVKQCLDDSYFNANASDSEFRASIAEVVIPDIAAAYKDLGKTVELNVQSEKTVRAPIKTLRGFTSKSKN